MKVFALVIFQTPTSGTSPVLLSAVDISGLSFPQKNEFLVLTNKTIEEQTPVPAPHRQIAHNDNYAAHVNNRGVTEPDQLVAMIVTDHEYPVRTAFALLSTLLDEFLATVPQSSNCDLPSLSFPDTTVYPQKYQDPREVDPMMGMEVQAPQDGPELDETQLILRRNVEHVLERGEGNFEKFDGLSDKERSDRLSIQSKAFYNQAQKRKSQCCVVM